MKTTILLSLFFVTSIIYSQELSIGAGLTLGTEVSASDRFSNKAGFGANVRGVYKITPKWGVTGGFTYYFPTAPAPFKLTLYQFNFGGMYSFVNNGVVDFYGLFGFDTVFPKVENESTNQEIDTTEFGLEVGLGIMTTFGIFFEAKAEGAINQGQFTLGYLYKF